MLRTTLVAFLCVLSLACFGQQLWTDIEETNISRSGERQIIPNDYRVLRMDVRGMQQFLSRSPKESDVAVTRSTSILPIPMPDGGIQEFRLVEYAMMEPELAARYPEIRTYRGRGVQDIQSHIRVDWTVHGFRAMIVTPKGSYFLEPYETSNQRDYISYFKRDLDNKLKFECHTESLRTELQETHSRAGDCVFRSYRLAVATTGEYSSYHGASTAGNATDEALVLSAVTTVMNRVNGVYEEDVPLRMVLIAATVDVFYYDGSNDPYTNGNGSTMLGQNQTTLNSVIGSANYDIGHVFSTGGGGVASLRGPCNSNKARGVTGQAAPIGDPFSIDYVAHEMGHQYGANHTQNNSCGRNGSTAMEPGSASTIMGYAGICTPNVQTNSDAYFHGVSQQEMGNFVTGLGSGCPTTISYPTPNSQPVITPGLDYTIPISTPFALTAIASDPQGDTMTYNWEQYDNETGATMPPASTNTQGPMFRSEFATLSPTRYFPNLPDLVNNIDPVWEELPSVSRNMDFRVTVRDYHEIAGCNSSDNVNVTTTTTAGPFLVTGPNNGTETWMEGQLETVTWNVAGTNQGAVDCDFVDILLSYDGGLTYPVVLASSVANSGTASVPVPAGTTTTARVMVMCADNIFFDISNNNFEIEVGIPDYSLEAVDDFLDICPPGDAVFVIATRSIAGYSSPITLTADDLPPGTSVAFSQTTVSPGDTVTLTISDLDQATPDEYTLLVQGSSTSGNKTIEVTLKIAEPVDPVLLSAPANNATGVNLTPNLTWQNDLNATSYLLELDDDSAFGSPEVQESLSGASYALTTALVPNTVYYWRVRGVNACGNGSWSTVREFETLRCFSYGSEDVPVSISSSGSVTVFSDLLVYDEGTITDVNVLNIEGTHSWVGDLEFLISHDDGTQVSLVDNICGNTDDFDFNMDDEAASVTPCPYNDGGTYQPVGLLSDFDNKDLKGNWEMQINDVANFDGGTLNSWSIEVCVADYACNKTVFNTNDDGEGSIRDALNCTQSGDTLLFDAAVAGSTISLTSGPLVIDHDLTILGTGMTVSAAAIAKALIILPGVTVTIDGLQIVAGSSTLGSAIDNQGGLVLKDVVVKSNTSFPANEDLIHNQGQLTFEGNCLIDKQ